MEQRAEQLNRQLSEARHMLNEERELNATQVRAFSACTADGNSLKSRICYCLPSFFVVVPVFWQKETVSQHQELMAKIEKLHLLEDSNRLLRDENTHLSTKLAELNAKAQNLENQIEPLQRAKEE